MNSALAADRVAIDAVEDPELTEILAKSFTLPILVALEGRSETAIQADIDAETRKLTGLMRSLGYLDARIETKGSLTAEDPLRFQPVPGPLYRIGWIRIDGLPAPTPEPLKDGLNDFIFTEVGKNATRQVLENIADGILFQLREASYGKATVAAPDISLDRGNRSVGLVFNAQTGTPLAFGKVQVEGSFRISEAEAQTLVPFVPGDPYSKTAIDALLSAFEQTDQFRRVRVDVLEDPDVSGRINVFVQLRDSVPDPNLLDESSGIGPTRLILTMLMIVVLECVRVTSIWSHTAVRRALMIPVILMVGVSGVMALERIYDFLS